MPKHVNRVARVVGGEVRRWLAGAPHRVLMAGAALLVVLVTCVATCSRGNGARDAKSAASASASQATRDGGGAAAPIVIAGEDLWVVAEGGEEDDLARLADREGAVGLVEVGRGADAAKRKTALRALAYSEGFVGLPWLAEVADGARNEDADDAKIAASSIETLAARKRTAEDPEDGAEMREGCDRLVTIAKNPARPKPVRIAVVRALRMWLDRGCARPEDIPADLDAR